MAWKYVRSLVSPLDLMFFHGADIVSKSIDVLEKFTTGSGKYTHVGCVVNHKLLPNAGLEADIWYIWESTFSSDVVGSGDVNVLGIDGPHFGPQLRKLDDVIPAYLSKKGAKVAWGKLKNNPWYSLVDRPIIIKRFQKLYKKYNNVAYDYNPISLIGSVFKPLRQHNDKLFCSELVAVIYIKLGILGENVDPSGVVPVDFLGYDRDHEVPCLVSELIVIDQSE